MLVPHSLKGQPKSWFPVGDAELTLVKLQPITTGQPSTAHIKVSTGSKGGGLSNAGYWGIPVQDKHEYQLSVIIQSETADSANQVLPMLHLCTTPNTQKQSVTFPSWCNLLQPVQLLITSTHKLNFMKQHRGVAAFLSLS